MNLTHTRGIDTAEAYKELGVPPDPRSYDQAAFVLKHFGITTLRLLTNNPRKMRGLVSAGFEVERVPLESEPTETNRAYLRSKAEKLGHMMKAFGTDQ
jgi:3,4-dihydroxy 2-butanone 4-phosphate synthase/GTP cyclohydrolase II